MLRQRNIEALRLYLEASGRLRVFLERVRREAILLTSEVLEQYHALEMETEERRTVWNGSIDDLGMFACDYVTKEVLASSR